MMMTSLSFQTAHQDITISVICGDFSVNIPLLPRSLKRYIPVVELDIVALSQQNLNKLHIGLSQVVSAFFKAEASKSKSSFFRMR